MAVAKLKTNQKQNKNRNKRHEKKNLIKNSDKKRANQKKNTQAGCTGPPQRQGWNVPEAGREGTAKRASASGWEEEVLEPGVKAEAEPSERGVETARQPEPHDSGVREAAAAAEPASPRAGPPAPTPSESRGTNNPPSSPPN